MAEDEEGTVVEEDVAEEEDVSFVMLVTTHANNEIEADSSLSPRSQTAVLALTPTARVTVVVEEVGGRAICLPSGLCFFPLGCTSPLLPVSASLITSRLRTITIDLYLSSHDVFLALCNAITVAEEFLEELTVKRASSTLFLSLRFGHLLCHDRTPGTYLRSHRTCVFIAGIK